MNYSKLWFVRPAKWLRVVMSGAVFACLFASLSMAQDRALIISIDSYADSSLGKLPHGFAKNNSAAIKKLLTEKLGYKAEHIKVLQNRQATKSAILTAISTWLGPEKPKNIASKKLKGLDASGALKKKSKGKSKRARRKRKKRPKSYKSYLYFAGFGLANSGNGSEGLNLSLVPYDASLIGVNEKKIIKGAIANEDLQGAIAKFIRRRTTLVIDTKNLESISIDRINVPSMEAQPELRPLVGSTGRIKRVSAPVNRAVTPGAGSWPFPTKVTLWLASSSGQKAMVAGSQENPIGLFTTAYVSAIVDADADANANGIISNAEVLHYVSGRSSAYCRAYKELCTAGLKPVLRPVRAYGRSAWINRPKISRSREHRLTLTRLADFIGMPVKSDISLKQVPPSPLKVGAGNIHYQVMSKTAGHLILLNLTSSGALFQLYPNQFAGQDENGFAGKLLAGTPLKVPEETYGISFSATVPAKGHIIAVYATGPVKFKASVNARSISSISPREAIRVYLAELAAALNNSNRQSALWSVVTLPYEILP